MSFFTNIADSKINNLLSSALKLKYCFECPIVDDIKKRGEYGLYPRWGAGTVNAPIHLILERPGNQYLLTETGKKPLQRAAETSKMRKDFSEIMFTIYEDGVRYLEGILLFLYGSKAREFGFIDRVDLFLRLVHITEFIKCPGKFSTKVGTYCSQQYLAKEMDIITTLPNPPVLFIIASRRYNRNFPNNFPKEIHQGKKQFFTWKNMNFLHIKHPSGLKYLKKDERESIHKTVSDFKLKHPEAESTYMIKSAYILSCLRQIPSYKKIRKEILERLDGHI